MDSEPFEIKKGLERLGRRGSNSTSPHPNNPHTPITNNTLPTPFAIFVLAMNESINQSRGNEDGGERPSSYTRQRRVRGAG
jgi:hypothetical protein